MQKLNWIEQVKIVIASRQNILNTTKQRNVLTSFRITNSVGRRAFCHASADNLATFNQHLFSNKMESTVHKLVNALAKKVSAFMCSMTVQQK